MAPVDFFREIIVKIGNVHRNFVILHFNSKEQSYGRFFRRNFAQALCK